MKNDKELSEVLEAASTDYLMDDNDGIVLDIYCKFFNDFINKKVKKIRQNATAAADSVSQTLKVWIQNTSKIIKFNNENTLRDEKDFVVIQNEKECKKEDKETNPIDWALRFVHILLDRESGASEQKEKKALSNQKADVIFDHVEGAFDHFIFALAKAFTKVTDIVDEVIIRHEDVAFEFMASRSTDKKMDVSRNNSITGSANDDNLEKKITFDFEDKNAPEEWKIFFHASHEMDDEEEDAVIVEFPAYGVISLSSQDTDSAKSEKDDYCNEAENDDEDDSWAMLEDDM